MPCIAPGGTGSLAAGSHLGHRQEGFEEAGHPLDVPSERLPCASVRGTVAGSLVRDRITAQWDNSEGRRETDRGRDLSTYFQAFYVSFLLLVPTPTCSAAGHVCTLGRLPRLSRGQTPSECQAQHPAKDTRAIPTTGPLAL